MAPSAELGSRTHRHALPRRLVLVTLVAVLALALAAPAGAARKPPKPKRCPTPLTKVTVPSFSTAPPGSGTTTTTAPCRAVELDKQASYIGVLRWGISQPVPSGTQLSDALVDLALRDDGHGKLTGKLSGTASQTLLLSTCPSSTVTPGTVSAQLTGTRGDSTMGLVAKDVRYTPPQITPCPGAGTPGLMGGLFIFPQTAVALKGLKGKPASYRYHHKETLGAGPYPYTLEYSILVLRVKK